MAKYKLCPGCGQHVAPSMVECPDCEADLVSVPVSDDEAIGLPPENAVPAPAVMIRRCDCGAENPAQARKCSACGEDISDIVPTPAEVPAAREENLPALISVDGQCRIVVCDMPIELGRAGAGAEYLKDCGFVSRKHARLSRNSGELTITDLNSTNFTYVNGELLRPGVAHVLHAGDEVSLGGCVIEGKRQTMAAYFTVQC